MKNLDNFIKYLKIEKNYSSNTLDSYYLDIKEYITYINDSNINIYKITYMEIKSYLGYLYDKDYKATTISRHISALRSFYNYLYNNNLVDKNAFSYISMPKKEKRIPKYMTNEDISIIFDIPDITSPLGVRNRLILELLYGTGVRISELCNILLKDINIDNRSIRIIGKGDKERIVYYGEVCSNILELYINESRRLLLKNKHNDYLLVGLYKKGKQISVSSVRSVLNSILKSAAIKKNITPHTFRHTFATHLLNEGCDILIVKELLGHESLDTTGIYTHVSNEKLRGVYLNSHPRAKKH